MAATEAPVLTSVRRPGLRREIGFIGLLWASTGSIIGSGWLFGAQTALATAGPAAIISWAVGGLAIVLLALVHAELGAAYPVAGGTARFPHYAFGGVAGASFGWFSWLFVSATWLPVYLVGMGAIVYLSDFGPLENPWFPLWWDMLAVAIFSLGIYAWAQPVALPTEEIERMVGTEPGDEPELLSAA
jgi:amino acid transporter